MQAGIGFVTLVAVTLAAPGLRASEAYVDGCSTSPFANGTWLFPYHSLWEALELTATNDDVFIERGSYPERIVLDEPVTLHAAGGPVLIGAHYVGVSEVCVPLTFDSEDERAFLDPHLVDCPGGERGLMARAYWPALDPESRDFACPAPFPVVIHAHGNRFAPSSCSWNQPPPPELDYRQAGTILSGLAAIGVLAISVHASPVFSLAEEKSRFLLHTLDYVQEQSLAGGWLEDRVDLDKVALSGHSMGGAGAVRAANEISGDLATRLGVSSIPIRALGLLAPAGHPVSGAMPVLVIHSGNEHAQQVGDGPIGLYGGVPGPRHLVTIAGANHFGYTDAICLQQTACAVGDTASEVGGAEGERAHRLQRTAARQYYQRFFSRYLLDDPFREECALLQWSSETCGDPTSADPVDCNETPMVPPPGCGPPACLVPQLSGLGVGVTVCSCVS